jgi:heme/copper-type cytochrome/quinol oxidase subunit 1
MTAISPTFADDRLHARPGWLRRYIFSTDHKVIGIQFLFAGLLFFLLGGLLAMLMRWHLAWADDPANHFHGHPVPVLGKLLGWDGGFMPAEFYNMLLSMHATIMIFFVLIPLQVGAFGNYLIPLKIGARDMAFPFLNGLAFWLSLPAAGILLAGICLPGGAAATGWTAYPPLSAILYNSAGETAAARSYFSVLQVTREMTADEIAGKKEQNPSPTKVGFRDALGFSAKGPKDAPLIVSTWPTLPILANFTLFFLLFAFVGTYAIDAGNVLLNFLATILLSTLGAILAVRLLQVIAFDGQSCWFLSLLVLGCSSVMGAINYLTTILKMRCPGMTMMRMPLTLWNLFITSLMILFATPVLASVLVMNLLDHLRITSFFEPANWVLTGTLQSNAGGGYALLHQHLFWFYSHPAVYIMILPTMGIVSDIIPVFSRKPIFGYGPMVFASGIIALLGFVVWGHHMFQNGMNPTMGATFAASTMLIAVPSGVKVFNWLASLYGGAIRLTVPMLNAVAFVSLFVIGGLSGIVMASSPIDAQLHNTYYIVAHIHYVLFGGSTFGIFAAIYFWYPKMFGRMMNAKLGYIHTILTYIAFNCTFFAMHILGFQGLPRRLADYRDYSLWAHLQPMNAFITISAFVLFAAQIPFIINFFGSWIWGTKAPNNPWEAASLEWTTSSPPPHENFAVIPTVYRGPYEFSVPGNAKDWIGQTEPG